MSTLNARLNELAESFAKDVLEAIRSASLEELQPNGAAGGRRRAFGHTATGHHDAKSKDRLPRRSPEDIARTLDMVLAVVKKSKEGMRAEEIRKVLGLDVREVPRVLKQGVANKKLRTKGQKRATTYFVR